MDLSWIIGGAFLAYAVVGLTYLALTDKGVRERIEADRAARKTSDELRSKPDEAPEAVETVATMVEEVRVSPVMKAGEYRVLHAKRPRAARIYTTKVFGESKEVAGLFVSVDDPRELPPAFTLTKD